MTFRHSGKLGDIVYGLAAVSSFPCSDLYVNADGQHTNGEIATSILALLQAQPYIGACGLWAGQPFDHDLDRFRLQGVMYSHLADCHFRALGLPPLPRERPWIHVEVAAKLEGHDVAFTRSVAHRGAAGFWHELYKVFGHRAFFLGSQNEHRAFVQEVGPVPYVQTPNLLRAAELIAGSTLLVGNQTCLLAIAEGLKHPLIQEVHDFTPNCVVYRTGCYPVWHRNQIPGVLDDIAVRRFAKRVYWNR